LIPEKVIFQNSCLEFFRVGNPGETMASDTFGRVPGWPAAQFWQKGCKNSRRGGFFKRGRKFSASSEAAVDIVGFLSLYSMPQVRKIWFPGSRPAGTQCAE